MYYCGRILTNFLFFSFLRRRFLLLLLLLLRFRPLLFFPGTQSLCNDNDDHHNTTSPARLGVPHEDARLRGVGGPLQLAGVRGPEGLCGAAAAGGHRGEYGLRRTGREKNARRRKQRISINELNLVPIFAFSYTSYLSIFLRPLLLFGFSHAMPRARARRSSTSSRTAPCSACSSTW